MSESSNQQLPTSSRQTIDELEIDKHVNDFVIQLETAFSVRPREGRHPRRRARRRRRALPRQGHPRRIDERTEGRFAPHVDKVRETRLVRFVTKLAEYRPATQPAHRVEEIETPTAE